MNDIIINVLSGLCLAGFIAAYRIKLYSQRQKGVDAFTLGRGGKDSSFAEWMVRFSSSLWGIIWPAEVLFSRIIERYTPDLLHGPYFAYAGVAVTFTGLVLFCIAMLTMKDSWRVGIDVDSQTALVRGGIYRFSRNPAFTGFDLMFIGLSLTFSNIVVIVICVMNILSLHMLILHEEKFLAARFGEAYLKYKSSVPRYIFW